LLAWIAARMVKTRSKIPTAMSRKMPTQTKIKGMQTIAAIATVIWKFMASLP